MILIILATISINVVLGENGLIAKAEQSKSFHELEKERERLELVKTQVATDVANLGKVTVDKYVEELIKEKLI